MSAAARAAEMAARGAYGRLLALLSARTRDLAQAEDALSEAFAQALSHWPAKGVPANPDAWLLTVARNRLTDRQRQQSRFPTEDEVPDMPADAAADAPYPDNRLSLMMVCAHPAIPGDLHAPMMLQTVLGLEAKAIARLFLMSPAALSKRLVRAKAKIRDAGIPFRVPDAAVLPERCLAIYEAVYALHAHDWLGPSDTFGEEALYLADLLCRLLPRDPEALGLAALIAFSHARSPARVVDGVLIPTEDQDTDQWDDTLTRYGNQQLARAHAMASIGRFQVEAAIESVHLARKRSGQTDWVALNKLYYALLKIAPGSGALVAHAAVTGRLHGPDAGLAALSRVEAETGTGFQPLWAARADMLSRLGRTALAQESFAKAISLTTDGPTLAYLKHRQSRLEDGSATKPGA